MKPAISALCLMSLSAACDGSRATADECTRMLDRYTHMVAPVPRETIERGPDEEKAAREELVRQKKATDDYARGHAQCTAEVTKREYRCAMRAPNPESWQACID